MGYNQSLSCEIRELQQLRELSSRIGRDPLLAQASTGNSSIKLDGVLWMKASGKWMINAEQDGFLVAVDLAETQDCLRTNRELTGDCTRFSDTLLRSSIETAMHAVLPHRVVLHVHSVNAISWASQSNAPAQLTVRLHGIDWQWIPYVPSGLPLAKEIEKTFRRASADRVFVLGNHGLVVCGDSCEEVEELLRTVERRLFVSPRQAPKPNLALLDLVTKASRWHLPESEAVHALATDPVSQKILAEGILYPCQAIFLPASSTATSATLEWQQHNLRQPFSIIGGTGVVLRDDITQAELETLVGLMEVVQRIAADAPVRYLTDCEMRSVLDGGAYQYRELAQTHYSARALTI